MHAAMLVFIFLYGTIAASFAGSVAQRLPVGESVLVGRSRCASCRSALRPYDLVPIVSWLLHQGRCRVCKVQIPIRYPILEFLGGLFCVMSYTTSAALPARIVWCLFWLFMLTAAASDLLYLRIPNRLTLPGGAAFVLLSTLCRIQTPERAFFGVCVCSGGVLALIAASRGRMGMGDMKLYVSVGAMLGPTYGLLSFIAAACAGSAWGILLRLVGRLRPRDPMPFVPAILCGVVTAVYFGPFILSWYGQQWAGRL